METDSMHDRMQDIRAEIAARQEKRRLEKIEANKRLNSPYHVWRRTWNDDSGRPTIVDASKGYTPQSQLPYLEYEVLLTTFDWDEAEAKIIEERARG